MIGREQKGGDVSDWSAANAGRWSLEQMFMAFAFAAAQRSTCNRLRVGAVVAYGSHPVSAGYNGAAAGESHCSSVERAGTCTPDHPCGRTVHAEVNALLFARGQVAGCDMYLTTSPCEPCAGMIINAGIKSVTYAMPYREGAGVARLLVAGLDVQRARGYGDVE